MLHQILERLGEKATPEIIKALAQVEAAMDNLKSEIEKSQQKSQGSKTTNIHWGDKP